MSKKITTFTLVMCAVMLTGCSNTEESRTTQNPQNIQAPEKHYQTDTPKQSMTTGAEKEHMTTEKEQSVNMHYIDISAQKAKTLIDENPDIVILDVSPKYAEGHIPGAINYYVGDGTLDKAIPTLDPEKTYLVYCHTDAASTRGAQKLIDAGFTSVYRLEGNYGAWLDAGFPVEK